jgi:hypothetical protein
VCGIDPRTGAKQAGSGCGTSLGCIRSKKGCRLSMKCLHHMQVVHLYGAGLKVEVR